MFLTKHWFFVGCRCGPKQLGDTSLQIKQWPNGSAADRDVLGRWFEAWRGQFYAAGAAADIKSQPTRIRTADPKL